MDRQSALGGQIEVQEPELPLHLECRADGLTGIPTFCIRSTPKGHNTVTAEFIDIPAIFVDNLLHTGEVTVEEHHHICGRHGLAEPRKTDNIGKEHNALIATASQFCG